MKNFPVFIRLIVFVLIFIGIGYTNPQIELFLDSAYHVSTIMHLIRQKVAYAYSPMWYVDRHVWHLVWATILSPFMPLATTSVFKIIYITQFWLGYILIYLATIRIMRKLLINNADALLEIVAAFAAFIYFFSTAFFNFAWETMYAVSYMITMPLAIYACGVLTTLVFSTKSNRRGSDFGLLGVSLLLILLFHAAELAYFFIYAIFLLFSLCLNRNVIKFIFPVAAGLLLTVFLLMKVEIFGGKFISLNSYTRIYSKDPTNVEIPITEWVYLSFLVIAFLAVLSFRQKLFNNKFLLTLATYSIFMAWFAIDIPSRIIFFFEPPYLTSRFIFGSFWFLFIPAFFYIVLRKLPVAIFSLMYITLAITSIYMVYMYSASHQQRFSLISKRMLISHDGDYLSRITYANFAKVDDYLKAYDCKKYIFDGNDDVSAAIGIAGCNSVTDYMNFRKLPLDEVKKLGNYQIVSVPDLFQQGDNQKYGAMWSIR